MSGDQDEPRPIQAGGRAAPKDLAGSKEHFQQGSPAGSPSVGEADTEDARVCFRPLGLTYILLALPPLSFVTAIPRVGGAEKWTWKESQAELSAQAGSPLHTCASKQIVGGNATRFCAMRTFATGTQECPQ